MRAKVFVGTLVAGALALCALLGGFEEEGRHCVAAEGDAEAPRCFDTFRGSIAHATNGRVTDAPVDPGEAMRDQDFLEELFPRPEKGVPPSEEVHVLALVFEHANYGGGSVGLLAATGCDGGESHRYPNLGRDWNDRASSVFVDTREGCGAAEMHQHAEFGGRSVYVARQAADLGGFLNDRTSSVTIEPLP